VYLNCLVTVLTALKSSRFQLSGMLYAVVVMVAVYVCRCC